MNLLRGRAVFLSASTPSLKRSEVFRRIPDAQREIERAVVCVARAVFAAGGRLVFGGHPSIAPLVAFVASEFSHRAAPGEPLVTVHQLDVFRQRAEIPDATVEMERLGHARIEWYPTRDDERGRVWGEHEVKYRESLNGMRAAMIADDSIVAMIAIGGMEGVLEEARLFAKDPGDPHRPIFVLATTGGASALLLPGHPPSIVDVDVSAVQANVLDRDYIQPPAPELVGPDGETRRVPLRYTPYLVLAEEMIERVA